MRAGRTALQLVFPRSLRPRREKSFGTAPSHRLDGNAKARVWATAAAYNSANRQPRQHQGPLTWATLRVLRALLWRFHGADGGGRCFPSYERIATAAKCHRDSVCVAIAALEDAGLLTWVHRLTRIRRREQDLFGHWGSVWQVIRTSNGYQLLDPSANGQHTGFELAVPKRPVLAGGLGIEPSDQRRPFAPTALFRSSVITHRRASSSIVTMSSGSASW